MFGSTRLILENLWYHWRLNLALALGVTAGTAVLCGALIVGDSVRWSLRQLTLQRLGRLDSVLVTDRFFRQELSGEVQLPEAKVETGTGAAKFQQALPAILLRATLKKPTDPNVNPATPGDSSEGPGGDARQARGGVAHGAINGVTDEFWEVGQVELARGFENPDSFSPPGSDQIVLNASAATALNAVVGDEIIARLPEISEIPRDSVLADKTNIVQTVRLTLSAVLSDQGFGRFSLQPNQQTPNNAFVDLQRLQQALGLDHSSQDGGSINAILVTSDRQDRSSSPAAHRRLNTQLSPQLADYGLRVQQNPQGTIVISSTRMLIDPPVVQAIQEALAPDGTQLVMTYLANTIAIGEAEIPYSTIAALNPTTRPPLGPFLTQEGSPLETLGPRQIALNSWAAKRLKATLGDLVTLEFFDPESTHTEARTRTAEFKLVAILKMEAPAIDPTLTPQFPGITDRLTIRRWNPPFPFDEDRITDDDEEYWDQYKTAPKAFISLSDGQRLFSSRFGNVTGIRLAPDVQLLPLAEDNDTPDSQAPAPPSEQSSKPESGPSTTEKPTKDPAPTASGPEPPEELSPSERISEHLRQAISPQAVGFQFQPVKARQLQASAGTTPFEFLFLGFSMFIIASALMLVGLLFRLGVEGRARQVGIMMAAGFSVTRVRRLLITEGVFVALIGAALGIGVGIGYAWLMLAALRAPQWWLNAIRAPFLELHLNAVSLALGYVLGVLTSGAVIWYSVGRLQRLSIRRLLSGQATEETAVHGGRAPVASVIGLVALLAALALVPMGFFLQDAMAQAGAFFGSGALVLTALLCLVWIRLKTASGTQVGFTSNAQGNLAFRNGARHPGRSALTVGLVAAATFLIVALSAFRLDPSLTGPDINSGNGGFTLVAQSDQPILQNLNRYKTPEGADSLNLFQEQVQTLQGTKVFSLRLQPGSDSSCLNLYQTSQPQILGVPQSLIDRGGFAWAGTLGSDKTTLENPWLLLNQSINETEPRASQGARDAQVPLVPIVLDQATAQWGLHVGLGADLTVTDGRGQPLQLRVVGLLSNSLLQGSVLMSEEHFTTYFPQQSGYRFFLLKTDPEKAPLVAALWEDVLGDQGFAAESAQQRLADFLNVQNTYLLTFQTLGGLGLLLGTFGLAIVQLRNVLERQGELALMRAFGFRRRWLGQLVMLENFLLLLGGLGVGILSALLAVLPHLLEGGAVIPWLSLGATLAGVLIVGLLAGFWAVRNTLAIPLLPALRSE